MNSYHCITTTHFVLHLPEKFFLAHIIQPQSLADTSDEAALKGHDREGNVIGICLRENLSR